MSALLARLGALRISASAPALRFSTEAVKKRGQSGYNVYFSEQMKKMRAEDKVTRPSDLTKIIGKNWSALSEVEKAAYKPK